MERSEPSFIPQWLKNAGSVTGGGNSTLHSSSSSSHSDVGSLGHSLSNRNSRSISEFNSPRAPFLERTFSSNSRRSYSNGTAKHAYSSFSRSHRDKDREREKLSFVDHWDRDSSDPLGNILANRDRCTLRRSQSVVSRKQTEIPHRVQLELKNGGYDNHIKGNGLLSGPGIKSGLHKAVFEKDFPSLGSEDKHGMPEIVRVSSPGFSSAVQSLPAGNSAFIGGEGWTSALAEVPNVIGNSVVGSVSAIPTVTSTTASVVPSGVTGLNMAEALAQAPSRNHTAPQISVKTQRIEEIAIKQLRQLRPVTPLASKGSVLTSDKLKPKTTVRGGEMNAVAIKSVLQQPPSSHQVSQSLPSGHLKADTSKTSLGKLLVLKPARENGVPLVSKDVASPTNSTRIANNLLAVNPSATSPPVRMSNSPKERKVGSSNMTTSGFLAEKRPISQTQSRIDFFNCLKKKTLTTTSGVLPNSCTAVSSPVLEKSEVPNAFVNGNVAVDHTVVNGVSIDNAVLNAVGVISNGNNQQCVFDAEGENVDFDAAVPNEEEAAFLRSLGWEENPEEVEALTQEEINNFYQECLKLRPTLKVRVGMQHNLSDMRATGLGGASAELSSSDS